MIHPPTPVFAIHDDGNKMEFRSCSAAAKWIAQNVPGITEKMHASSVLDRARSNRKLHGWSFKLVTAPADAPSPVCASPSASALDPFSFVFGSDAGDLFRGKTVRVTTEDPRRVSVIDVIRIVCDVQNPSDTWATICKTHHEFIGKTDEYQFSCGRPTPVTTVQGLVELVNLLPGKNAAKFRASGAKVLIRFMGGDTSLIPEVLAINQAHASGATQGTIAGLCAQSTAPPVNKYAFLSPSMKGKDMHTFIEKEVVYLLVFTHNGINYIKLGTTTNLHTRITEHIREIPGVQIWYVVDTVHARKLEGMFKKKMRYVGHLTELVVNNKKQTEILVGITPEDAEASLTQLYKSIHGNEDDGMLAYKMKKLDVYIQEKELDASIQIKQMDLASKQLEHDLTGKLLDLLAQNPSLISHIDVLKTLMPHA